MDGSSQDAVDVRKATEFDASWNFDGNHEMRYFVTKDLDIREDTRLLLSFASETTGSTGAAGKKITISKKVGANNWAQVKEITMPDDTLWHTEAIRIPGTAGNDGMKTKIKVEQKVTTWQWSLLGNYYTGIMVMSAKLEVLAQDIQDYNHPLPSKGVEPMGSERIDGRMHTSKFKFDGDEKERTFVTRAYDMRQPLRVNVKYEGSAEANGKKIILEKKTSIGAWGSPKEVTITDTHVHEVEWEVTGDKATKLRLREETLSTPEGKKGKTVIKIHAFSLDLGTWHSTLVNEMGTSMATPTVAGGVTLVREYYKKGFYRSGKPLGKHAFLPSASLVKATVLNSGQPMTGPRIAGFPGFGQGFGRMALDQTLYINGKSQHKLVVNQMDMVLKEKEHHSFDVEVKDNANNLKVTIAWTDPRAPGGAGVAPGQDGHAVINDLELLVTPVAADGKEFKRDILGAAKAGLVADPAVFTALDVAPGPYMLGKFTFGKGPVATRYIETEEYDMRKKTRVSFWAKAASDDAKQKKVKLEFKKDGGSLEGGKEWTLPNSLDEIYCEHVVDAQHAKVLLRLSQKVDAATDRDGKEKIEIRDFHIHFDHWGNEDVYKSLYSGAWNSVDNKPIEAGVKQIRSNNNVEQVNFKPHANNDKFRITVLGKSLPNNAYPRQDYSLVATAKDLTVISPLYRVYLALDDPNPERVCKVEMVHGGEKIMRRFPCPNEEHIFNMRPLNKFAGPPEVTVIVNDLKESCLTTIAKMHVVNVPDKAMYAAKDCNIQVDTKNAGLLTGKHKVTTKCTMQVPPHAKHRYEIFVFADPLANQGRNVPLSMMATVWDATKNVNLDVSSRSAFNNGQALVSFASTEESDTGLGALTHVQLEALASVGEIEAPDWHVGEVLVYDVKSKKLYHANINANVKALTRKIELSENLLF